MAIVRVRPDAVIENLNNPVVDEKLYTPAFEMDEPNSVMQGLLQYVEGYPWSVNYYGQLLGKNNDLKDFDPAIVDAAQQYYKINNLVLRVESPLTSDYNGELNTTSITGAAFIPHSVTANVGDIIIADIENGEPCAFRVTKVERKSHRKTSVYSIDYVFLFVLSNNKNWFDSLEGRVQQTVFYHQEREALGLNSKVTPSQNEALLTAREFLAYSKKAYFKTFFNQGKMTLVLPNQEYVLYDYAIVNFIRKITDTNDAVEIQRMYLLTSENNSLIKQRTIWDAIYEREPQILFEVNKKQGFVSNQSFRSNVMLGGLAFLSFDYVMYPKDPDLSTKVKSIDNDQLQVAFYHLDVNSPESSHGQSSVMPTITTINNDTVSVLHELFKDDYYLVSSDFYDGSATKSYMEIMINKFIHREVISVLDISMAISSYNTWSRLHQFYLTPVLWYILTIVLYEDVL